MGYESILKILIFSSAALPQQILETFRSEYEYKISSKSRALVNEFAGKGERALKKSRTRTKIFTF